MTSHTADPGATSRRALLTFYLVGPMTCIAAIGTQSATEPFSMGTVITTYLRPAASKLNVAAVRERWKT